MSDLPDRAAGSFVALAYGDALGVHYEFGSSALPVPPDRPRLLGGGLGHFEPGEWSGDTQLAVCVAQAASRADLRTEAGLDAVAEEFEAWHAGGPADIGLQTSQVLHDAAARSGRPAQRLRAAAGELHARTGRTAGNGALVRTAPIVYRLLGDTDQIAASARAVAELTHADPVAGDSCVLWALALDSAIRTAAVDLGALVAQLPTPRQDQWTTWIEQAELSPPTSFAPNGYTVATLQAAWSAVTRATDAQSAIEAAIEAGDDTDTVAAVAGALAGAIYGRQSLDPHQIERVHGWPGLRADDLAQLAGRLLG
jgi:ADP-ribosyl-[dinitrogen reductase] hydrolase